MMKRQGTGGGGDTEDNYSGKGNVEAWQKRWKKEMWGSMEKENVRVK